MEATGSLAIAGRGLLLAVALVLPVWAASVARRDASLVDRAWGLLFVALAWLYAISDGAGVDRTDWLLLALVTLWGARLSAYITWRNWGAGEDPRYRAMRERRGPGFWWLSLFTIFGLQALLAWVIALPLFLALTAHQPAVPALVALGIGLWMVGFGFEAIGDWQLARFKADPANRGRVMDQGLWGWTRHPNYFGDACLWWGFYCFAAARGGWWTIPGPLLMTALLLKVSGVALLEKRLAETRPAYREYVRRTSAFLPRPPRPRA